MREKLTKLLEPWLAHLSLAAANDLIENGVVISNSETTTKWIPVTERLPEDGVNVLWIKRIDGSQMIAKYEKRRNVWTDGHYYGGMNGVTHWMPLPEPPKGE